MEPCNGSILFATNRTTTCIFRSSSLFGKCLLHAKLANPLSHVPTADVIPHVVLSSQPVSELKQIAAFTSSARMLTIRGTVLPGCWKEKSKATRRQLDLLPGFRLAKGSVEFRQQSRTRQILDTRSYAREIDLGAHPMETMMQRGTQGLSREALSVDERNITVPEYHSKILSNLKSLISGK